MDQEKKQSNRYHIDDIEKLDPNDSHRIILELIGDAGTILDVGCSTGFLGSYLKSRNRTTVGVESDAAAAAVAKPHYDRVVVGDITAPHVLEQLADKEFDAVVLGDVIEHLVDPWTFIKDIIKKLADNGSLIISIPHLGHASVIASLLSETFQYREVGLLDRTHVRFFSLQSLCSLLVDAGLTPSELKRVVHGTFSTEIPLTTERLPTELFPVLDRCPESRTYQFVMKAVKSPPTEPVDAYVENFSLPLAPASDKDLIVKSYAKELETFRNELREARDYISVCTKNIREKDDGIRYWQNIAAKEQEEKENLQKQIAASPDISEDGTAAQAETLIETRVRKIHTLLPHWNVADQPPGCGVPYDILIPIYNAYDHVEKCMKSVLSHTGPIHQIYLLDDSSTDARILPLLTLFAEQDSRVHVLPSERNKGFIENINRGFGISRNPVIILNSDTEVTSNWIERMHRCLLSRPTVGIVNPLSNNATILSVPVMNSSNKLPEDMTPDQFAALVAASSRHVYRSIPTAVGFCMLISRSVLDQVGNFDPAFGLGYGEENDFCERAKQLGFEIACCDDAYVHHYGEASFNAVPQIDSRRAMNMQLLNKRWPKYNEEILTFCRKNPLRDVQERIYHALRSQKGDNRPAILHVIHNFNAPGGTELHTRDLIDGLSSQFHSTVLYPASQPSLWSDMSSEESTDYLRVVKLVKENEFAKEGFLGYAGDLSSPVVEENFARFVSGGKYEIVHFQHFVDWDTLLLPFIAKKLGIKIVISLHDYYLLCPEYNLLLPGNRFRCGKNRADESDPECLYCLGAKRYSNVRNTPMLLSEYMAQRFAIIRRIFSIADAVIVPSTYVRNKFLDVLGSALADKFLVFRHGIEPLEKSRRLQRAKNFRVGFLGGASDRKGIFVYLNAALMLKQNENIKFEIFGGIPPALKNTVNELGVIAHGAYLRADLPKLLSRIDIVVIPSVWDETFCLTVSEAQAMGVPVLASDLGAIPERIIEGKTGFLFKGGDANALASSILSLSSDINSLDPVMAELALHSEKAISDNCADYSQLYRRIIENQSFTHSRNTANAHEDAGRPIPTSSTPDIASIVILTFNQLKYTRECVERIRKHTPEPHEIIFVDNGSTDGTIKWLRQLVKDNQNYKLIENKKNLGFAKGCNQGITAASGEYIMLLNNDVVVTDGWLSGMIECLNSSSDIGIVGPMTNNISGPQKVEAVGYTSIDSLGDYAKTFRERNRYRRIPIRRVVGFCMLFKRELVDKIGLLDESFGTGNFEDDDFCLRAALEGYRNMIAGDVFIHHYGSISFIGNRIDYGSAMGKNKNIFSKKWSGIDTNTSVGKNLMALKAMEKADELNQAGQLDKAVDYILQEGIRYSSDDRRLYLAIAEILMDAKHFKDALDTINEMPGGDEDIKKMIITGYCKQGMEQDDEAEQYADRALSLDQHSSLALNLKGIIAYKRGKLDAAEAFFKKSIESDNGYGEPYTNLGLIRWDTGEKNDGLDLLERGVILSPKVTDSINLYHSAITETGEFERAEKLFRELKSFYPMNKTVSFLLIDSLIKQGKSSAAMQEIERAMVALGVDDGILGAALEIRNNLGPHETAAYAAGKNSVSLCMIVKNEEQHIAKCLMSLKPLVDEIIIVDTGSSDRTKGITTAFGAKVFDFPWAGNFSDARNFSISKASGQWIFVMDADEVISPLDHAAFIDLVKKAKPGKTAYKFVTRNYITRVNIDKWNPNDGRYIIEEAGAGWSPSEKVRLFPKNGRILFENPVHELVEPSLKKERIAVLDSKIPVHHYGKLDKEKERSKGEQYFQLGMRKLKESGNNLDAICELAIQAGELEKYDEALELWQKAIRINPDLPVAFMNIGYIYLQKWMYAESLTASKRAMELKPDFWEAISNYSVAELCGGDIKNAISILEGMLKKNPKYLMAAGILSAAYCCDGQREKGLECFARLNQEQVAFSELLSGLAKQLLAAGRVGYATLLLEAALESSNINTDIPGLLTECYHRASSPHNPTFPASS